MSEQSGGGPITREQVERAIEAHDSAFIIIFSNKMIYYF